MNQLDRDIVRVLFDSEAIEKRVTEMGKEISEAYEGGVPLLVGVLKGCTMFMSDLIKHIEIPLEIDFIAVTSYHGTESSSGAVRIVKDLDRAIEGRELLVIEGIVDTGMTIGYILRNLQARQPKSIRLCTFLDKPARRIVNVPIDFRGYEIPDRFVVGYGLDFLQLYRNLPYIGILKDQVTGLEKK
ncbi:hypothetical protein LCGC14_1559130 [marine sediment metagenome]|uniref:hypoxanthine phosphoribosyltransferase n=1 Tax=marine sediment metagenome TaxID=412755 RepID=A0A0F9L4F8_9ZZZZ